MGELGGEWGGEGAHKTAVVTHKLLVSNSPVAICVKLLGQRVKLLCGHLHAVVCEDRCKLVVGDRAALVRVEEAKGVANVRVLVRELVCEHRLDLFAGHNLAHFKVLVKDRGRRVVGGPDIGRKPLLEVAKVQLAFLCTVGGEQLLGVGVRDLNSTG